MSSRGIDLPVRRDLVAAEEADLGLAAAPALFGRERELRSVLGLLDREGPRGLVLVGDAGIGKTAILREAIERAHLRGWLVLTARPSGAEVQLSFAALGDLLGELRTPLLAGLPGPQRQALEVALLRADGPSVDDRAIGSALLAVLRTLAGERPVLLAIDDVQWLDAASAEALAFALRRIEPAAVTVLATCRSGETPVPLELGSTLEPGRAEELAVGPLTLAAVRELLASRLAFEPSRPTLVSLFEAAGGNPFVALELARELVRRGARHTPGAPFPVPVSVRDLVAARIGWLPAEVRELLLAAAGLARPTVRLLERLQPDADVSILAAAEAGLVELGPGGRVSFSHPLLARVPYERLGPAARRRLHARLAEVVDDTEERARHSALAASRQDEAVARELDRAVASAGGRGAPRAAAELSLLAARLTPAASGRARCARSLAAAEWHERAGEIEQAAALAHELLRAADADGGTRARALSLLATVRAVTESAGGAELYDQARREPGAPRAVRAEIHRRLAQLCLGAGDASAAARHAGAALRLAAGRDRVVEAGAAALAALVGVSRGHPLDRSLLARARSLHELANELGPGYWPETGPEVIAGVALLWAGELEDARGPLERALASATERDEPWAVMHTLAYLSSVWAEMGEPERSLELARRYCELADGTAQPAQRAAALWVLAVPAAWLGREEEARAAAGQGLELAQSTGRALYEIGCLSTLGMLELSLERPREAEAALARARDLSLATGICALGRVPLLPDSVEALVAYGAIDHAAALAAELDRRATVLGSAWALALSYRCRGLIADARGDSEGALSAFERALAEHARQDRPLERARTELALGGVLRRAHRKRAARDTLEHAAVTFEAAGARLWSGRARRELGRIGGRIATPENELSATEASIVELARAGRTNREVATALHLSPRTVEWNLSKIYRKLGVRSRTELAATSRAAPEANPGVPPVDRRPAGG